MRKFLLSVACAALLVLGVSSAAAAATDYANCSELNADYPHGVGQAGAVDSTSGTPVTTFTVDDDRYEANSESDRDGDGIACEKR